MNHFGVNFDLMDKLHMVAQLLQVTDVAITNLTNDEVVLARAARGGTGFEPAGDRAPLVAGDGGDGDAGVVGLQSAGL